jgi:signal transduction histidine kinase
MEGRPKVLFVDDEQPILNTLKRIFKNEELDSYFADSAETALKILEENEINILVVDYRMPEVDGLSLLKLVKDKYPEVMRIILTGYPDLSMLLDAVNEVGIFRVLLKPWRNEELKHAINQALEYQHLQRENRALMELTTKQNRELREMNSKLLDLVEEKTREWLDIKEKLIQMDKLSILGFMTSVVAHELNNPLTVILAITEMSLKELDERSEIYKNLKEIDSAATRCREIVNRYLKFTRSSRNEEMTPLSIRDVINNAISMMKPLLTKKSIDITTEIEETPMIYGNFNRLLQVFLNLIRNSMDSMDEGGKISIKVGRDKNNIIITIADTGKGIPETIRDKIFMPFFTTKDNGTGLGLSIVDGILKDHGGKIKLNNSGNQGTIFTINLPYIEQTNVRQESTYN